MMERIKEFYTPSDIKDLDYERDLGNSGEYPFTRGIYPNMYRGRIWTMRQFSGFGSPEETNKRLKCLLSKGQTGLSVAFHMPTLLGYDSDHPLSLGEVGRCGVAVDTLKDMEIIFDGIPLNQITTSMTINSTAPILLAMYIAVAEKQGAALEQIGGTIQNDILKEYIAQKEYIYPINPSVRMVVDIVEFCTRYLPRWNTISISGYHIREKGASAVQELAFTLADGITYVEEAIKRGLRVDDFAPRLSFFFDCHMNFFEEIAKFRAARRMWAKIMRENFRSQNPRSWMMRFHTQTAGCSLTVQQPENNVTRVAIEALAAVLGGTQSLHTNARDEALCLPTEEAVTIALRTQQIIAHESDVTQVADPLAGSYFIENLTNRMEEEAGKYLKKIGQMGGMIKAIEKGFPQQEIERTAYEYQTGIERGKIIVVGINKFTDGKGCPVKKLKIGPKTIKLQLRRLERIKKERNSQEVALKLENLRSAALGNENLMPLILEAVKVYATVGEISDVLRGVFGEYRE